MDLTEQLCKGLGDPPRAATDLEYAHLMRGFALTNVAHVREDLFGYGLFAGCKEIGISPDGAGSVDIMAGILQCALIPVGAHLLQLMFHRDVLHRPSNAFPFSHEASPAVDDPP